MAMPDLAGLMKDSSTVDAVSRLSASPKPPFVLQHHPNSWEVVTEGLDEPTYVPVLSPREIRVGANGIRTTRPHEAPDEAYRTALDEDKRRGMVTIPLSLQVPADCLPAGVPAGRYIRSLDVQDPTTRAVGVRHVEAWNIPVESAPGARQDFIFDRASWNKWRVHLVESGVIKPPLEAIRVKLVRKLQARVLTAEVDNLPDEVRQRRVAEKTAVLDTAKAAKAPKAKPAGLVGKAAK